MDSQCLREVQEERSKLLKLQNEAGWKWFMGLIDSNIESRRNHFELVPLDKMDDVLREQYLKGEIAGLRLIKAIVPARIEELENEIDELEQEIL